MSDLADYQRIVVQPLRAQNADLSSRLKAAEGRIKRARNLSITTTELGDSAAIRTVGRCFLPILSEPANAETTEPA